MMVYTFVKAACLFQSSVYALIILFLNNFSPSDEQPKHCKLAQEL